MMLGNRLMRQVLLLVGVAAALSIAAIVQASSVAAAPSPSPTPTSSQPQITLSASTGRTGAQVIIRGTGFPPLEIVALYVDQPVPYLDVPGPRSDAEGSFRRDITWPGTNYDGSGRINPTVPGPHAICGDTAYPGSTQPVAAKACAQFVVLPPPSPSASPGVPNSNVGSPASPLEIVVAAVVLIVVVGGMVLWMRRTG